MPLDADGATSVAHCALDAGRTVRLEAYLGKVAHQAGHVSRASWARRFRALTTRQRELLELLARDENPASIARHLHRSLATVRNHIQNSLRALGLHSVQQAVALFLLHGDGREDEPSGPRSP
jgi:DNA-binding NarL/FixJ family response regulator